MEREARCLCGELSIKVKGDPKVTLVCNCNNCQRRTGSVFGAGAYFSNDSIIEIKGSPKHYQIQSDSGNSIISSFCPNCGTTLLLKADMFEGMTGIPMGCFTDPDFPEPQMAVWNQTKYNWVEFPEHWHKMEKQIPDGT